MLTVITVCAFDSLQLDGVDKSELDNDVGRKELRPDHILIIDICQWHFTMLTLVNYTMKLLIKEIPIF
jgi:hypothetical protein